MAVNNNTTDSLFAVFKQLLVDKNNLQQRLKQSEDLLKAQSAELIRAQKDNAAKSKITGMRDAMQVLEVADITTVQIEKSEVEEILKRLITLESKCNQVHVYVDDVKRNIDKQQTEHDKINDQLRVTLMKWESKKLDCKASIAEERVNLQERLKRLDDMEHELNCN